MAPQELQGQTLGEKHRNYNKLVEEALKGDTKIQVGDFNTTDTDVHNLVKIDVAAKNKNVDYILKILQCEDMLYVSRAIKWSSWLITDRQYSHIINPHYLHTQLFPQMMSKACAKLMLHIRLHLQEEDRVEAFYEFMKEKDNKAALKWLPQCSVSFIEKEIEKIEESLNDRLVKRLCERSINILDIYIKKDLDYYNGNKVKKVLCLLRGNEEKFLNIIENLPPYQRPSFGSKATGILMKTCRDQIVKKFEVYSEKIHLQTFAKHLKKEEIIEFLLKMSENQELQSWFKYDNLKHFVRYLPKEGRFDFLKKVFIEKSVKKEDDVHDISDMCPRSIQLCSMKCSDYYTPVRSSANIYRWYRFAQFEVAFADLVKLIRAESAPTERIAMFGVLLSCAGRNPQHVQTVLQHYNEKHINEPFKFKIQFVNMVLTKTETYKFNETVWNTLNNLFHSMEVYVESENNVQSCVEAIILYKILHNEKVPEIIEKKFKFRTMKSVQMKLSDEEKEKVFSYLYEFLQNKIKIKTINSESDLTEAVEVLETIQSLLTDWKKDTVIYSWTLEKIEELVKIKNTKSWKANLSTLYNKNKSWRRVMFKDSLLLSPSEDTCYNALKHDSELMVHYKSAVEELRRNDSVSLRRVLRALRVYWPQSMAAEWLAWYLAQLDQSGGHKAVIRGFCTLAPQRQITDIIKKYAPSESKINWSEDDELVLSLRKHLARNMYVSRPLPSLELVLLYSKGDYLQFSLPSLNSVLHNISTVQTREQMTKLLDAPVSLQKHGLRLAFTKLESEELKEVFHDIWKKAKNPSIRAVLFKQTYDLLCRQTKPTMVEEIWELLRIFIENLSTDENKIIYDTLTKYDKVPLLVRGKFFMKSYTFLKALPPKANCVSAVDNLMYNMKDLVEYLDTQFVEDVLLESLNKFTTERYDMELMASYLLCSKDVESQTDKYKKVVLPLLERAFPLWEVKIKDHHWVSENIIDLLKELQRYLQKFVLEKDMTFPVKLFLDIQVELEKNLPVEKNYLTLTTWKLIATLVQFLEEHKSAIAAVAKDEDTDKKSYHYYDPRNEKKWNEFYLKAVPKFSKTCLDYLREDVKKYFPSIYWIFASCLDKAFINIPVPVYLEYLTSLLEDEEFIPSYMVVLKNTPNFNECSDDESGSDKIAKKICEIIFSNPSTEIKMHYYRKFPHKVFP